MTLRLQLEHTTGYAYPREVASSYNEARLVPQTTRGQLTLSSAVQTTPAAPQQCYWDYWGTQVTVFDLSTRHDRLQVVASSVVDTADATEPGRPTWAQVAEVRDRHAELIVPSIRTTPDVELLDLARRMSAGKAPYDVVMAVEELVRERVSYVPGSTGVQTSALEAWRLGKGVCQDIAHVTLAFLRATGLPARYVSGYLHPKTAPEIGVLSTGESHAWVEVWLDGWWATDPTNGIPAGERHVVVARGRDYTDVPPLKGVYAGGGSPVLSVNVSVTRLA